MVRPDTEKALHALETGDLPALCMHIGNVLQGVSETLRPEIVQACDALRDAGAVTAHMTGSGSAVFGVFRSPAAARKALAKLSGRYRAIYLCHTQHDSLRIAQE